MKKFYRLLIKTCIMVLLFGCGSTNNRVIGVGEPYNKFFGVCDIKVINDIGKIVKVSHFSYNYDGKLWLEEVIKNNRPLSNTFNYYDSDGNKVAWKIDSDADGVIDTEVQLTFNDNGQPLSKEVHSTLTDQKSSVFTYLYNDTGNLVTITEDNNNDGIADMIILKNYDNNGNLVEEKQDYNGDGTIENLIFYSYDTNGRLSLKEIDRDADRSIEWQVEYSYDEAGNLILIKQSANQYDNKSSTFKTTPGGNLNVEWNNMILYNYKIKDSSKDNLSDKSILFEYDDNGNLVNKSIDRGNNGSIEENYLYNYDC